jgi:hypothetical protein
MERLEAIADVNRVELAIIEPYTPFLHPILTLKAPRRCTVAYALAARFGMLNT